MKKFIVQWNSGRRFPNGARAADEFWNNRYYIGNVKMVSDGRMVLYVVLKQKLVFVFNK